MASTHRNFDRRRVDRFSAVTNDAADHSTQTGSRRTTKAIAQVVADDPAHQCTQERTTTACALLHDGGLIDALLLRNSDLCLNNNRGNDVTILGCLCIAAPGGQGDGYLE